MIMNGIKLIQWAPILVMTNRKLRVHGVSYGLSEAGYDIRIKQKIEFNPDTTPFTLMVDDKPVLNQKGNIAGGRFTIASAIEEFDMPKNLVGVVHDKSTWARKGLSVSNTVIESGWKGFLTLELVFNGYDPLIIPAGAGIAQVIFHQTIEERAYEGKYQNQENMPVAARDSV